MKKLLCALTVAASLIVPTAAEAACDDLVNYMIDTAGNCISLDNLALPPSAILRQQAAIAAARPAFEVRWQNPWETQSNDYSIGIAGSIKNQSNESRFVSSVAFQLEDVGSRPLAAGIILVATEIPPGEELALNGLVFRDELQGTPVRSTRVRLISIQEL